MTELTVICTTPGCPNEGVEVIVTFADPEPEQPTPTAVFCGPCGGLITTDL